MRRIGSGAPHAIMLVCAALMLPAVASAGTIRYSITNTSAPATIKDNGNGIAKVEFESCLVVGQRATIGFTATVKSTTSGTATWSVLHDQGEAPTHTFSPPSVTLTSGVEQSINVSWSFTLTTATRNFTMFRVKLDAANGEGLGNGAGIMVRVSCVVPPPGGGGGGGEEGGGGGSAVLPTIGAIPTAGRLQSVAGAVASGRSRCVGIRSSVLRVGRASRLRVFVHGASELPVIGSLVRITGPGFVRSRLTDSNGLALFNVQPRRRGRVVIQSDVCLGSRVLAALRSRSSQKRPGQAPRFTG